MARVILAGQMSGTRNGKDWPPAGTELELPDDEAAGLIRSGMALDPADDRVKVIRGELVTDELLAGAPGATDRTLGQVDTNLSRARAMAGMDDPAAEARAAHERLHGLSSTARVFVGDDNPNPTDAPSIISTGVPANHKATDDGARLIETASVDPGGEKAADTSKPTTVKKNS